MQIIRTGHYDMIFSQRSTCSMTLNSIIIYWTPWYYKQSSYSLPGLLYGSWQLVSKLSFHLPCLPKPHNPLPEPIALIIFHVHFKLNAPIQYFQNHLLSYKLEWSDHYRFLHMSQQLCCRDMCKICSDHSLYMNYSKICLPSGWNCESETLSEMPGCRFPFVSAMVLGLASCQ